MGPIQPAAQRQRPLMWLQVALLRHWQVRLQFWPYLFSGHTSWEQKQAGLLLGRNDSRQALPNHPQCPCLGEEPPLVQWLQGTAAEAGFYGAVIYRGLMCKQGHCSCHQCHILLSIWNLFCRMLMLSLHSTTTCSAPQPLSKTKHFPAMQH